MFVPRIASIETVTEKVVIASEIVLPRVVTIIMPVGKWVT